MTIRRETETTPNGTTKTTLVWDPADTIVKVAKGATENALTLCIAPFKLLGWVLSRGGEAVRVDREQEKHQ